MDEVLVLLMYVLYYFRIYSECVPWFRVYGIFPLRFFIIIIIRRRFVCSFKTLKAIDKTIVSNNVLFSRY